jgi:hypothetical protein
VDRAILHLPFCIHLKLQHMCVSPKAVLQPAEFWSRQWLDCSAKQISKI